MVPLAFTNRNSYVEIKELKCESQCCSKLKDLGILKGHVYRVMSSGLNSPCILLKDGNRIGIGCGMALKILVSEIV